MTQRCLSHQKKNDYGAGSLQHMSSLIQFLYLLAMLLFHPQPSNRLTFGGNDLPIDLVSKLLNQQSQKITESLPNTVIAPSFWDCRVCDFDEKSDAQPWA